MSLDHNGNGPPASNPDSVILIMFCIMGILSTIYVIISIIKMGIIKISLARMVLILNVAVGCRNICYIPYVYRTNETCQVIGALSWYFTFIILLVIHMMMKFLAVELFQSSPPQHYLSQIFLIPIIPTIIPVSLNVYDTKWQFCDMRRGEYIIPEIIMNILSWSLLAVIYYELYLVIKKLLSISLDLYNLLQKKLFGGPGIYAVVAAFFSLIMTFSTLCSFLLGNEMDASHYYLRVYFPAMFSFVSSIVYAIIFYWQSHFFENLSPRRVLSDAGICVNRAISKEQLSHHSTQGSLSETVTNPLPEPERKKSIVDTIRNVVNIRESDVNSEAASDAPNEYYFERNYGV